MRDVIFKTFADTFTPDDGTVGLGGFAVDEYMCNLSESARKNAENKKIFGVIIDPKDSYESIDAIVEIALHAFSAILMFDINYATGRQISHIRNLMKAKKCDELTDLYETRIAFVRDI